MKYEWRKQDRTFYGAKEQPAVMTIPCQTYITINGTGNPNTETFAEKVGVLYSLAYQIRSVYKTLCTRESGTYGRSEYQDYAVFPLEGIWTSSDSRPQDKELFIYTIMIRQPAFITKDMFDAGCTMAQKKKPHPLLKEVFFTTIEDGTCVQMLHKGSYDDEPASFDVMDRFAKENGLHRCSTCHREIYLTNAQKTAPDKLKTVLRFQVEDD